MLLFGYCVLAAVILSVRLSCFVGSCSEHHVSDSPMLHQGWAQCRTCGSPTQTLSQSYDVFTRLRELGIRAHSWV